MKLVLRMVGGPYDGWELPCEDHPKPYVIFAGLPYNESVVPTPMTETIPTDSPRAVHVEYKSEFVYKDSHKHIVVYSYWHGTTERRR